MNELIEQINLSWAWTGLYASSIIQINDFGNIIIEDINGKFWRICPEELSCIIIADNSVDFEKLMMNEEFLDDWIMKHLVELAKSKVGNLSSEEKYCLKIPGILGGKYEADNLSKISLLELISFSGNLSSQIKDLPDGNEIKLNII